MIFVGFKSPEGFRGVGGGRGYILTEFGPKRTHQTLVHTIFHDSYSFFDVFCCSNLIYLCQRDTGCVGALYICVIDTEAAKEPYISA